MNNKPYNLLVEAYILGGFSAINRYNTSTVENELNDLAKKFGYNGLEDFDKHFPEESNTQ